ncbi:MAG: class I tRNA ligase family protein, partial [Acidobacteriota bacterium]
PECKGPARRETDTMDTFVDSAWYFYRYLDPDNATAPFRAELARAWFPIDLYIGGITHAILHLMYARFFSMVMRDLGLGVPGEPVKRLLCQGMVLKDGSAMSKSRGNVVAPETMVDRYGADVTRLFVLFAAPPERDLEWNKEGVEGLQRFLRRVWRLVEAPAAELAGVSARPDSGGPEALALRRMAHGTLARVTHDIEQRIHLNTAIAATMELTNALYAFRPPEGARGAESLGAGDAAVLKEAIEILLICLAPFAPHLAEEGWSRLGHGGLIARHAWPEPDSALLVRDEVTIVVQINGRIRGRVTVARGAGEEDVLQVVRADARLAPQAFPDGEARPSRTIFVPDRLINVVTSC